jgi:peptide/nickel transport system permease protein
MSLESAVATEPATATFPKEIPAAADTSLTGAAASQSQLRRNLRRFLIGNKLNLVGLIVVAAFLILAIFGQAFAPYNPYAQDITGSKLLAPSLSHPMGTDELGRDLLSRVMTGTRISLEVAVVVLGFAVVFGTLVGSIAGYFGGIVDELLMRFTDMFLAFPALILAIAIAASLGRELH